MSGRGQGVAGDLNNNIHEVLILFIVEGCFIFPGIHGIHAVATPGGANLQEREQWVVSLQKFLQAAKVRNKPCNGTLYTITSVSYVSPSIIPLVDEEQHSMARLPTATDSLDNSQTFVSSYGRQESSNNSSARGGGRGGGGTSRPDSQRSKRPPSQMSRYSGKVGLNQG